MKFYFILFFISCLWLFLLFNLNLDIGYSLPEFQNSTNYSINITEQREFKDLENNTNIVGSVENNNYVPLTIKLGLNITNTENNKTITMIESPFSSIIYPFSVVPFKFIIQDNYLISGDIFTYEIQEQSQPFLNLLVQNYSKFAQGKEKALIGTIKNPTQFVIKNVTVYAIAYAKNGTQIDSIKNEPIDVINPNQEISFKIIPDPSVKKDVWYYGNGSSTR